MNSVFSFNKYKKILFFIFGCWLLPENDGFARVWGLQPPQPSSPLARTLMNFGKPVF